MLNYLRIADFFCPPEKKILYLSILKSTISVTIFVQSTLQQEK